MDLVFGQFLLYPGIYQVSVMLGNGNGSFQPATSYGVGNYPFSFAIGDADGDGKADIIAASRDYNRVDVFLGNGNGTFQASQPYLVGANPVSVLLGDFNGDGRADIVTANSFDATLTLLLGAPPASPSPTLTTISNLTVPFGTSSIGLVASVINGLATSFNGVAQLVNEGTVTFTVQSGSTVIGSPATQNVSNGSAAASYSLPALAAGTYNVTAVYSGGAHFSPSADVSKTLTVSPAGAATTVTLVVPGGNFTYGPPITLSATVKPSGVSGSVFFYDGPRLLGSGEIAHGTATLTTILSAGVRSLTARYPGNANYQPSVSAAVSQSVQPSGAASNVTYSSTKYSALGVPRALAIADFDNNGAADIAVVEAGNTIDVPSKVEIFFNDGKGTLQAGASFVVGMSATALVAADFNGDGKLDLAISSSQFEGQSSVPGEGNIRIFFGNGGGTFSPGPVSTQPAIALGAGDFNRDGKPDLIVLTSPSVTTPSVMLLIGNGDGTFQPGRILVGNDLAAAFTIGDFNGDGRLDVAALMFNGANGNLFLGNGDGTFQSPVAFPYGGGSASVADFNGDGFDDLAVGSATTVTVLYGSASSQFQSPLTFSPAVQAINGIAVADFNRDGQPDIVLSDLLLSSVFVQLNAHGGFTAKTYSVPAAVRVMAIADLNGDYLPDIVTAGYSGNQISVLFSSAPLPSKIGVFQSANWALDSNGNFQWDGPPSDQFFNFTAGPGDVAVVGDWNGDGHSKAGVYHNGFWLLDYNGNGIWDGVAGGDKFIALGGPGYTPVVGDWNGDGRTKVGYYYNGFWALDYNGNGQWDGVSGGDRFIALGGSGYIPVVGDWNGDGRTKVGYFKNGTWALDYNGDGQWDAGDKLYTFSAGAGDVPVVGDWSGTHSTKIGVYHNGFWLLDTNGNGQWDGQSVDTFAALGGPGYTPVVGDWNADGRTKIGFYTNGFWALDFNGNGQWDGPAGGDKFVALGGTPGEQPVVGKW